jgi:hypothetical protein
MLACGCGGNISATSGDGAASSDGAAPGDAPSRDAPVDAAVDAPPDAPDIDGAPLGFACGTFTDGGIPGEGRCADGLLCCPVCCQSFAASCSMPATNDAGIGAGQCPLPDLHIDQQALASQITVTSQDFAANSCEIMEGCITTPGTRTLLGFSVKTPNFGTADLHFGDPANSPLFVYSQCHGHYHFRGYAQYRLLDAQGTAVVVGRKQAFCLLDLERQTTFPLGGIFPQYTCADQGISVGWADIYGNGLPCQYLDVTDVPPGTYTLEVTVNPERIIPELDYSNNTSRVTVMINGVSTDPTAPCMAAETGAARDCGWNNAATFSCVAGTQVTVGCGATCGLGSCTGDTVMRVCAGSQACRHSAALAENDDCMPGDLCSQTTFLCPSTGQYHVMTGSFGNQAYTCNLAHNP